MVGLILPPHSSVQQKQPPKGDCFCLVGRVGIEPTTQSLKGSCSTTELPAQLVATASYFTEIRLITQRENGLENR